MNKRKMEVWVECTNAKTAAKSVEFRCSTCEKSVVAGLEAVTDTGLVLYVEPCPWCLNSAGDQAVEAYKEKKGITT